MPRRTNSDLIRDLERTAATLAARVDQIREDLARLRDGDLPDIRTDLRQFTVELSDLKQDLALLKQKSQQGARADEQSQRRSWAIQLAIMTAVISGAVSLLVTLVQNSMK